MPNPLNSTDNIETIKNWLEETLSDRNPITPHENDIPNVLSIGINFWFMKLEGYQNLNKIKLEAFEPKFSKNIGNEQWDLVYLGNESKENLNRHIYQNHDKDSLKTLSILRKKIGALLSDDLIDGDIQNSVSDFIHKNLMVFWVNDFACDSTKIFSTENTLKLGLKPLFVKPNNPLNEILNDIKDRRDKVYNDTTYKHFGITNGYLKYKYNNKIDRIANWIVENRWKCDNIGHKEISLKNTEINKDMGGKLNEKLNITNNGIIIFKLFKENTKTEKEEKDNKNVIWKSSDLDGWRFTRSRKQDLQDYFENVDTGDVCRKYESIINNMGDLQNIYFKFYYLND